MDAAVEFEKLASLLKHEATDTIPMSVRARYEERLAALRATLQGQRSAYPLGALLVSIGAVTDEQLNRALSDQKRSETAKLLGELLVESEHTNCEKLSQALAIQSSIAQTFKLPY